MQDHDTYRVVNTSENTACLSFLLSFLVFSHTLAISLFLFVSLSLRNMRPLNVRVCIGILVSGTDGRAEVALNKVEHTSVVSNAKKKTVVGQAKTYEVAEGELGTGVSAKVNTLLGPHCAISGSALRTALVSLWAGLKRV